MKLKKWLVEQKQLTYEMYKSMPEEERWQLEEEHRRFCRWENQRKQNADGWRKMNDEERAYLEEVLAKEKERYEKSLVAGGIDERGNYTALHYRWDT